MLEVSKRRKMETFIKLWRLNNSLLNNQEIKGNITGEIREYSDINKNENKIYQNLRNTVKVLLRGKFTALNT